MKRGCQKLFLIIIVLGATVVFGVLAYTRVKTTPISRTQYIMGTLIEIVAAGKNAERAIEAAFDRMREIERQVGRDDTSDISILNSEAGTKIPVATDTWNILTTAKRYWQITDGAFDITAGALVDAWGFGYDGVGRFPSSGEIKAALPKTGSDKLLLFPGKKEAQLGEVGMAITVGGIAKGYAVEEAMKVLKAAGIQNAMINGGSSSIKVMGAGLAGRGWRVGIEDPRHDGKTLGVIVLKPGEALGTSADNKRFFIKDGRRYSHIIDPRTGYPAAKDIASVTVITHDATIADVLTKALFLNDLEWSKRFLKQQNLKAVLVKADGAIYTTPGLQLER
ncbi:MAG TPA: FAD:protein FMN transferase [Bacillota bacterium]|nr:FAD:protein FMN transferase [Bacillota bacterium]